MSLSDEWTEWHFNAPRLVTGKTREDFARYAGEDPEDSVLVCRYRETQSSMYSKMDREFGEVRRSGDEATIKALLAKFGECPRHL
jgi:hypothetical protein